MDATTFQGQPTSGKTNPLRFYLILGVLLAYITFQVRSHLGRRILKGPLLFAELDRKSRIQKWIADSSTVLRKGYALFQKGVPLFRVTVEDGTELVMLNSRYLAEVKNMPDDTLDFTDALDISLAAGYTHLGNVDPIGQHAIRSDLTPSLPRLMPVIASEARLALQAHFSGDAESWMPIHTFEAVLNAVAQVSARLFVGERLCRDQRWLNCSKSSTLQAFKSVEVIKQWPAWMRPIVSHLLTDLKQLEKVRGEAKALLLEDVQARHLSKTGQDKEDYLSNWITKKNPSWGEDLAAQVDLQLHLSVAAIHTTSMALVHMLYDLACHPEYVPILREEIRAVLKESGGEYNKDCIAKMVKVDSFMKESQRLNPPARTTFKRLTKKDVTLSDGTFLPKGTLLEVDGSVRYQDPAIWGNPDKFDALRFLRIRERTQEKGSHQFVTSNGDYVFWGQGKHACPGRFFATNEIKTLLAMFILDYDIKLPEGVSQRPENVNFASSIMPNPTAHILIRRVKT